jgi:hypothetical protein
MPMKKVDRHPTGKQIAAAMWGFASSVEAAVEGKIK